MEDAENTPNSDIDQELGVEEEYADELRERIDEDPIQSSLFEAVVKALDTRGPALDSKAGSGRWVALLVGGITEGVRETRRQADQISGQNDVVRSQAVSLYQERMVERALDGTLFDPLDEGHPETFREILVKRFPNWAAQTSYQQVQALQKA